MSNAIWLKQHATAERQLARDLAVHFNDQAKRVADAIATVDSPSLEDVSLVFSIDDERSALIKVVTPHLLQAAQVGALTEIDRVKSTKATSIQFGTDLAIDGQNEFRFAKHLPNSLVDEIQNFLNELAKQDYWNEIEAASDGRIRDIIREGLREGNSGHKLAKKIREALGGDASKTRAKAIARTETTAAMNAGHLAGMQELARSGAITGKTWLAILDKRCRTSHSALNDTTVAVAANFSVGGTPAPYPGHWGLPAEERVNCRCTIISDLGDV